MSEPSVEEVKCLLLEYMRDVASMCKVIESTARIHETLFKHARDRKWECYRKYRKCERGGV